MVGRDRTSAGDPLDSGRVHARRVAERCAREAPSSPALATRRRRHERAGALAGAVRPSCGSDAFGGCSRSYGCHARATRVLAAAGRTRRRSPRSSPAIDSRPRTLHDALHRVAAWSAERIAAVLRPFGWRAPRAIAAPAESSVASVRRLPAPIASPARRRRLVRWTRSTPQRSRPPAAARRVRSRQLDLALTGAARPVARDLRARRRTCCRRRLRAARRAVGAWRRSRRSRRARRAAGRRARA